LLQFEYFSVSNGLVTQLFSMLRSILDAKEILGQMTFNDSVTQVKDILLENIELTHSSPKTYQ
jgi:hypothetical protein